MQPGMLLDYLKRIPRKKISYGLAAAALCLGGIFFWKMHSQPATAVEAIPLVRTAVAGAGTSPENYTYSGEVRGRYESQLAFQVSGKIIKRNVQLGSIVHAGDVLLEIDPKDISQTLHSSSAQASAAEAQLKLAESNLKRYRQLYVQSAISQAQLDQYENAYELAQAAVQQASAQYRQSANQLDYSLLRADASGVIAAINAEAGQVVGAGQPVVTIVRDGEREVEISVPENRIENFRTASQLTISFWALPEIKVSGQVREIAPTAAAATRTYQVRVSLLNPPPKVKLGMTASVSLSSTDKQSVPLVAIPLSAIYQIQDTPGVWIVTDSTVHLRPVQIVSLDQNQAQVNGLRAGEIIVTTGVHKLREGQKVRLPEGANHEIL